MFIPEYDKSSTINGTKLAKIIRMNGLSSAYEDYMGDWGSLMFSEPLASVSYRMGFEESIAVVCECMPSFSDTAKPFEYKRTSLNFLLDPLRPSPLHCGYYCARDGGFGNLR